MTEPRGGATCIVPIRPWARYRCNPTVMAILSELRVSSAAGAPLPATEWVPEKLWENDPLGMPSDTGPGVGEFESGFWADGATPLGPAGDSPFPAEGAAAGAGLLTIDTKANRSVSSVPSLLSPWSPQQLGACCASFRSWWRMAIGM